MGVSSRFSKHLEDFQELVKSLEVNPMELGGVKDELRHSMLCDYEKCFG